MASIEAHDAAVERVRIKIVIKYEIYDPSAAAFAVSEQKRPALAAATVATFAQTRL